MTVIKISKMTTTCITVWPDHTDWIVSLDRVADDGGAETTQTLEVCDSREDAIAGARREATTRGLVAYEQTGVYGFSRPIA